MEIYHERQRLQFCLLHALNNLLQGQEKFTRQTLDSLADNLEEETTFHKFNKNNLLALIVPRHQHRSIFTGNYDANVLLAALSTRGVDCRWHDRRKCLSLGDLAELQGVIANRKKNSMLGMWRARHWITLRKINETWFNLDSDMDKPVAMENTSDLKNFLDDLLDNHGAELFLITHIPRE